MGEAAEKAAVRIRGLKTRIRELEAENLRLSSPPWRPAVGASLDEIAAARIEQLEERLAEEKHLRAEETKLLMGRLELHQTLLGAVRDLLAWDVAGQPDHDPTRTDLLRRVREALAAINAKEAKGG